MAQEEEEITFGASPAPKKEAAKAEDNNYEKEKELNMEDEIQESDNSAPQKYSIVDLPSVGLLGYPRSVEYRDIYWGDEKVLMSATQETYVRVFNNLMKSILNDIEWYESMAIHDRDFLVMWIWANNYSTKKDLTMTCPNCENKDHKTVDLTELDINELTSGVINPMKLTTTKGRDIKVRLFTVSDELIADKYVKNNQDDETTTIYDAMVALSVDIGEVLPLKEKIQWMENNLSSRDMALIRHFHEYFKFGVDDMIVHSCTKCNYEVTGRLPFRFDELILNTNVQGTFEDFLQANKGAEGQSE